MLSKISHLFGVADRSDALSKFVPITSFVDNQVFLTKTNYVGMCMELEGIEYETRSQENLETASQKLTAGNRVFDKRFLVYQHFVKRSGLPLQSHKNEARAPFLESQGVYSIRLYVTVLLELGSVSKYLPSLGKAQGEIDRSVETAAQTLKDAVHSYCSRLGLTLGISILDQSGIFEFYSLLLNPDTQGTTHVPDDSGLDYYVGNSEIASTRNGLDWGSHTAKVFSLKLAPTATFAHMLRGLLRIQGNLILCSEWRTDDSPSRISKLRMQRKRNWSQRVSTTESMLEKGQEHIADDVATDKATQLNQAISAISNGDYLGYFSLIAVVHHEDESRLRTAAAELNAVFVNADAVLLKEGRYQRRAFFSILPGNDGLNIRHKLLLNTNYADLSFVYRTHTGNTTNEHLDEDYLTVFTSRDGTPYYFNPHVGQVGHMLITGQTGSGKSVLVNQLLEDAQKYEGIHTFIVDVGGSYRDLTKRFGGTYVEVRLNQHNFRINPFSLPYTPNNVNRIHQLIQIMAGTGDESFRLTAEESNSLTEAVNEVYALREGTRRLGKISLPSRLTERLKPWTGNGQFAHFFDNVQDDLSLSRFSTWDYSDLEEVPQLMKPLMFYQFGWMNDAVKNPALAGVPKVFACDEGWRFGGNLMQDLIRTAAKTWRKHNGFIIFATQDKDDLLGSGLLNVLNTSCPTKIFLPNPAVDLDAYSSAFKLNEREQELLSEMQIGELLIKTPKESRRVVLSIPPERLEAYAQQFTEETFSHMVEETEEA